MTARHDSALPLPPAPPDRPHGGHLRRGRFSVAGGIYLVTTVTLGRRPAFADLALARTAILEMREMERRGFAETLAFVLMPDHLHWLLQLGEAGNLSRVVGRFKSAVGHAAGTRFWQPGFHDHALRRDEDLKEVARYVVANPLRAGLASRLGDWPHWDARWLDGKG